MDATDRRAGEYAKRVMRTFLPFQITELRERLELNRVEFEHLLGTGAKTDIRWEQGKVLPTAAVNALLFLLESSPDNVRLLAAWRGQLRSIEDTIEPPAPRQHVIGRIAFEGIAPQQPNVISMQQYLERRSATQLNVPIQSAPYNESTG
jgi:DNA-binding transcriptional regulator YiaG